jgi:hypothetical protein
LPKIFYDLLADLEGMYDQAVCEGIIMNALVILVRSSDIEDLIAFLIRVIVSIGDKKSSTL